MTMPKRSVVVTFLFSFLQNYDPEKRECPDATDQICKCWSMKIYKFKDFTDPGKRSHFYQIVLSNSIWCVIADSLNDEDEFKFKLNYTPSSRIYSLLSQIVAKYKTTDTPPHISAFLALKNETLEVSAAPIINHLINKCRTTIGIVSFSLMDTDDYLWAEYGGNGNGACIEIEIQDKLVGNGYYLVNYVSEKVFHVDLFLESALFPDLVINTFTNILLTKRKKWSEEKEIRFIANRQEVNMILLDARINRITFGANVPTKVFNQVKAKIDTHCNLNAIDIRMLSIIAK